MIRDLLNFIQEKMAEEITRNQREMNSMMISNTHLAYLHKNVRVAQMFTHPTASGGVDAKTLKDIILLQT